MLCHCETSLNSLLYAADLFSQQEKLAKSIHYLISKEDQVRTQITDLELLISQTEVRELSHAATTPTSFSLQKDVLFSLQKFQYDFVLYSKFLDT